VSNSIKSTFDDLVKNALSWGSNLIGNIIQGIQDKWNDLTETVGSVADIISNYLGFHSPTKKGPGSDADTWTPNLISMLAGGLSSGSSTIGAAAKGVVSTLADEMAKLADIEPVVSAKVKQPEAPALPKMPDAPTVEYQANANMVECTDSVTQEIETKAAAIEMETPTVDTPTITPEVETLTPEAITPQVNTPTVEMPEAQTQTPEITPKVDSPAITPTVAPVEPVSAEIQQPEPVMPVVEQPDTATVDVETQSAAVEALTPEVDVPAIRPDIELQSAEIEVLTPEPVAAQVETPEITPTVGDIEAPEPIIQRAEVLIPSIEPLVQQAAIEVLTPTAETPGIVQDVELQAVELEVSSGSLQDDIVTIFKSAAVLFAKTVSNISFSTATASGGQSAFSTGFTELMEDIKLQAAKFSASSSDLLTKLRTPAVDMEMPVPAGAGGGNVFYVNISGSNAEEIWEQLEQKMHRMGGKW